MLTGLRLEVTGRGVFELEGSFDLTPDVLSLIDRWIAGMSSDDAAKLAALVAQLKRNNDVMETSVNAHAGTFS